MPRIHNFSAGPATLPESVLEAAQRELLDYHDTGMSILEMSHRSTAFSEVIRDAEETLRRLVGIPEHYHVLFLQGGATLQFAGVPMNLMRTGRAGYVVSGNFARLAWQEATKYGTAEMLATSEGTNFDRIPDMAPVTERASAGDLDYLYICQNNTIFGTMYHTLPDCGTTPLVADVSSCFLSQPLNIERYGLVFAGAQKNAGPAGVTIIIVRDDVLGEGPALGCCPSYLSYRAQTDKNSMMNTPNTSGIYLCGKVFHWVEEQGGLATMEARNRAKADLLYSVLDDCKVLQPTADPASRSITNVTFRSPSPELDEAFVAGAREWGMEGLKGHRLVGGMRASIYNAVSLESVQELADYIEAFDQSHRSRSASYGIGSRC